MLIFSILNHLRSFLAYFPILVFFYLTKLIFCGFPHVEGYFARRRKRLKISSRDVAPLKLSVITFKTYLDYTYFCLGESLTSRYSRNTDQRLHTSFSSGEFARLKPKDMSSPLASDHSDTGRRIISPIRRRSDDVSVIYFSDVAVADKKNLRNFNVIFSRILSTTDNQVF